MGSHAMGLIVVVEPEEEYWCITSEYGCDNAPMMRPGANTVTRTGVGVDVDVELARTSVALLWLLTESAAYATAAGDVRRRCSALTSTGPGGSFHTSAASMERGGDEEGDDDDDDDATKQRVEYPPDATEASVNVHRESKDAPPPAPQKPASNRSVPNPERDDAGLESSVILRDARGSAMSTSTVAGCVLRMMAARIVADDGG